MGFFWGRNSELGLLISPSKSPQKLNFSSSPGQPRSPPQPGHARPGRRPRAAVRRPRACCAAVVARGCCRPPGFGWGCKRELRVDLGFQLGEKAVSFFYKEERNSPLRSQRKGRLFCIETPNNPSHYKDTLSTNLATWPRLGSK